MGSRRLIHPSFVLAIWSAALRASVCKWACGICAWEQGPRQVASSARITATPVTVYPHASCGLWACAQQSRLTVVPSGMTNYLSCLILACNSWMWTAALIRKNFSQQPTHLCYEIWQACICYSVLLFTDFQPPFGCNLKISFECHFSFLPHVNGM